MLESHEQRLSKATNPKTRLKPIAIFYHCLFVLGDPPHLLPNALNIVNRQMQQLANSGLPKVAKEFHVGINGSEESKPIAERLIPKGAKLTFHGLDCRNENLTIDALHQWSKTHPDWYILYFHSKGASTQPGTRKFDMCEQWRETMMADVVTKWRICVHDLEYGNDIVCSHWKWNQCDGTQHIPAGNFLWVTSDFAAKLPSIYDRERIKQDGIGALSSRYESEVLWGNGTRPKVKQFREHGGSGIP